MYDSVCVCKQTPFIAFYRKEHIDPELTIRDLWTVYRYDEKVGVYCVLMDD